MSHTTVLTLQGLTCSHCVGHTRKALEAVPGVTAADVTLEQATITGDAAPQALIGVVEQAGYHAQLAG